MVDSAESGKRAETHYRSALVALCCRLGLRAILLLALNIGIANVFANPADVKEPTRTVAVGPFFAPDSDNSLRQISGNLPDLLTVELSQQDSFHIVEREKVTAIWKELNLSTTGLVTPATVARLGHELACDWLVTGTLVPGNTRTQVWAKVIDVKSGVVVDMQALPFDEKNLSATIQGIAGFLAKAKAHRQTDRFVTLGRFTDLTVGAPREDWSRRLRALIEQHCRDANMGLVEREAVAPIFEEFQFERAGLTGAVTNRVKLQPAFWIVDGACKWVGSTDVNVTLRLQKIGGQEKIIEITKSAGPDLENAVLAALQPVLAPTHETTTDQLGLTEGKLHNDRGLESAANNDRFSRFHTSANDFPANDGQRGKDFKDNRRATIESFEKALLLNPKDVQAKYMLGYCLLGDPDEAQRERAKELMKEVVALNHPDFSKRAAFNLEHADRFIQNQMPPPRRAHVAAQPSSPTEVPDHIRAKMAIEALEKPYQLDPKNVQAQFNYGFALMVSGNEAESKRGKELLKQVVDSGDPTYANLAEAQLARVPPAERRTPAMLAEFLTQNFSKLLPMKLEATTNSDAKIQILHVKENLFEYRGHYYCGFQFNAPEWLDGDLQWIYFLAKSESNKDLSIEGMRWFVLPKSGTFRGSDRLQRSSLSSFAHLKQRFPFSWTLNVIGTDKERIEAGKPNAIWFEFSDQNVCNIAFAMTINSPRGAKEFGVLPLR